MGKWKEAALKKAAAINKATSLMTDVEASQNEAALLPWQAGVEYNSGYVIRDGKTYKINQQHTSSGEWPPETSSSLYTEIKLKDGYRIIEEGMDSTEAFAKGEYGWWNDVLYESTYEGNVFTPDQYPDGWKEVTE